MLACIPYDIYSGQISHRRKYGMRSVQKRYLTLMIRFFARYKQDIESRLIRRKFFRDCFRRLNYPKMKNFALHD